MRKVFFSTFCLLLLSAASFAQSDKKADFFIGYSNLQAEGITNFNNPGTVFDDDFFDRREGLHGFHLNATGYFNSWFGISGDFSWHRQKNIQEFSATDRDELKTRTMYFMAGPKVRFGGSDRVQPFVHLLAGGANTKFEADSTVLTGGGTLSNSFETDSTDFAMAFGGGIDVRFGGIGVRLIQVDYAPVFLRDRSINVLGNAGALQPFTLDGQRQDNIRISIGITF
jgi:opacity protein-like surface antigen